MRLLLTSMSIVSVCLNFVNGSGVMDDPNAIEQGADGILERCERALVQDRDPNLRTAASLLREANDNSLAPVILEEGKPILMIPMYSKASVYTRATDSVDTPRPSYLRRIESNLNMETFSVET